MVVSELEVASEYEERDRLDGSQGRLKRVNGERVLSYPGWTRRIRPVGFRVA